MALRKVMREVETEYIVTLDATFRNCKAAVMAVSEADAMDKAVNGISIDIMGELCDWDVLSAKENK
jgi:hypothetical protein